MDQHKIYGLVGYPLGHSFSRRYFTDKFAAAGIDAEYVNFEIPRIEDFPGILTDRGVSGLNVTIPYKQQVMPYLDSLDDTAAGIGAVNVIRVERDGQGAVKSLKGYNTDVIGFVESIRPMLGPAHRRALVLGTGGASKAVVWGLRQLGIVPLSVSRTERPGLLTYSQIHEHPDIVDSHTVIVNTTPVGMFPHVDECPDLPYDRIGPGHVCYDLVYNPEVTMFMSRCAERGASVKNGLEMLHLQAEAAWDIWTR